MSEETPEVGGDEVVTECHKTGCECPAAGWCQRHKMWKAGRLYEKCKEDERFFDRWEAQAKPGYTRKKIAMVTPEQIASKGRKRWKELHEYVWVSPEETQAWFAKWLRRIPSYGCSCSSNFADIMKELPPDFLSAESFENWAIAAHNRVNKKLGKPQWVKP